MTETSLARVARLEDRMHRLIAALHRQGVIDDDVLMELRIGAQVETMSTQK